MLKNGGPRGPEFMDHAGQRAFLMQSKRLLRVIAAGLGLLLVGSAVQAQERVKIALLPMVVHSAENPDYVRSGLADMLSARLERIPDFEVLRIDERNAGTTNLERAVRRAQDAGAEFVLFGSFTRFGTGASLDVHCAAATSRDDEPPLREIFVHSGNIGDVIPDLDDLVGKVARFVIRDYTDRTTAAGETPDLPSTRAIASLEARVAALEAALAKLEAGGAEAAVAAAGDE